MTTAATEIVPCSATLVREALALVLREIAPEQRAAVAPQPGNAPETAAGGLDGLWIARRGPQLCGAAWGQRQPGNTAIFWPPQLVDDRDADVATRLSRAVVASLDAADVGMTQVLLPDRRHAVIQALESVGFRFLAELVYLNWELSAVPHLRQEPLAFEPYDPTQRVRLGHLIERTYEDTRDCAALDGQRSIDDVIDGYRATGEFRAENWLLVRADQQDVGVLLLAEHPAAHHFELVYMGLVPSARGRGWGLLVTRHAQRMAARAGAERLVLAVDAANLPALAMYRDAGFTAWDRRSVFVRFRAT